MIIPFQSAHSSTLIKWDGKTYVTFFAGTREGKSDVAIWMFCVEDQSMWKVIDTEGQPNWNPVLFEWDGKLWLAYRYGGSPWTWRNAVVEIVFSNSGAIPRVMGGADMYGGPIKNKPIIMSNGELIAGFSTEHDGWKSYASILDTHWVWDNREIEIDPETIPGRGLIQPTLWESKPGVIHMLMRSAMGKVCRADSEDYGRTWCPAYPTDIPNNNSGIDVVRVGDRLYLALNPITYKEIFGYARRRLEVWELPLSGLLQVPWEVIPLENQQKTGAEYSYPAIIQDGDKLVVSYTYERKWIKVKTVELGQSDGAV